MNLFTKVLTGLLVGAVLALPIIGSILFWTNRREAARLCADVGYPEMLTIGGEYYCKKTLKATDVIISVKRIKEAQ